MSTRRILLFLFLGLQLLAIGPLASAFGKEAGPSVEATTQAHSDGPICLPMGVAERPPLNPVATPQTPFRNPSPDHLTHPCPGMSAEPAFEGVSPLSISYVPGMCDGNDVYNSGYGDIGVWQASGHNYVMVAGFARALYHIWNVDDPYNPVLLKTQPLNGAGASLSIFPFKQGENRYMSVTTRGSDPNCGILFYNVNDPANPQFISRKRGADWCTVHEHYISTNNSGDADYAWLTMSGEGGSGYKMVVLDIHDLANPIETGRYQRPDAGGSSFNHDVFVSGDRAFLSHWQGGTIVQDKNTLAHSTNPTPLNPLNSIRPTGFSVHHSVPSSDGNHLFIEDEFENGATNDKIKMYNIADIANPFYETGIVGPDTAATNRAHNIKIKNLSPGVDLLLDGWYQAGTRGFRVDYTGTTPSISQTLYHQLRQTTNGQFGDVWGVDYLPCTVRGIATTCLYSSDMAFGLVVDALGVDPTLDPYRPEVQITYPPDNTTLQTCNIKLTGTSHDYWTGVSRIEISVDGSAWQLAAGANEWSYTTEVLAAGSHQIAARGVDAAGNVDQQTIHVIAPDSCTTGTETPIPPTVSVTTTSTSLPVATNTARPTVSPTSTVVATSTPASTLTSVSTSTIAAATPTSAPATPSATACSLQFSDVSPDNTFYSYVQCLACRGIIGGYSCGAAGEPCGGQNSPYFRPGNAVSRGQIAQIVSQSAGFSDTPGPQVFEDVPPNSTFYTYVNRLATRGIMSGRPCGGDGAPCGPDNRPYFWPGDYATRGQIAKIVAGAAGLGTATTTPIFEDVAPDDPFFAPIQQLASRSVMGGYPCGGSGEPCQATGRAYFRPGQPVTRGQAAKIVSNTFFPNCRITAR